MEWSGEGVRVWWRGRGGADVEGERASPLECKLLAVSILAQNGETGSCATMAASSQVEAPSSPLGPSLRHIGTAARQGTFQRRKVPEESGDRVRCFAELCVLVVQGGGGRRRGEDAHWEAPPQADGLQGGAERCTKLDVCGASHTRIGQHSCAMVGHVKESRKKKKKKKKT